MLFPGLHSANFTSQVILEFNIPVDRVVYNNQAETFNQIFKFMSNAF